MQIKSSTYLTYFFWIELNRRRRLREFRFLEMFLELPLINSNTTSRHICSFVWEIGRLSPSSVETFTLCIPSSTCALKRCINTNTEYLTALCVPCVQAFQRTLSRATETASRNSLRSMKFTAGHGFLSTQPSVTLRTELSASNVKSVLTPPSLCFRLKGLFYRSSNLQYFKRLIQIPQLPEVRTGLTNSSIWSRSKSQVDGCFRFLLPDGLINPFPIDKFCVLKVYPCILVFHTLKQFFTHNPRKSAWFITVN